MVRCYERGEAEADRYWPPEVKPGVYVATIDGNLLRTEYEIGGLESLAGRLQGKWKMTGTRFLVNLEHVTGAFHRRNYFLMLKGVTEPARVSKGRYHREVKKALGVKTLAHLIPDTEWDKKLREIGIYEFGLYQMIDLDRSDPEAVQKFKRENDINFFPYEKVRQYFSRKYSDDIDILRMCTNFHWQIAQWIKWGLRETVNDYVRGLWYDCQAVIEHHEQLDMILSDSTFDSAIDAVISKNNLFKYRDFGFKDVVEDRRRIGEKYPQFIIFSEKMDQFTRIYRLGRRYGVTCMCSRGQPSKLTAEYTCEELRQAGVDFENETLHIFMISDLDAAGAKIRECMPKVFEEELPLCYTKSHDLLTHEMVDDDTIEFGRSKGIHFTYAPGGHKRIPYKGMNKTYFIRTMEWWDSLGDQKERIHTVQEHEGKKVHTVWKISSNVVAWEDTITPKFKAVVKKLIASHRKWHDVLAKLRGSKEELFEGLKILEGECEDERGEVRPAMEQALEVCARELVIDQLVQANRVDEARDRIMKLLDRFTPYGVLNGWRRVARKQLLRKQGETSAKKSATLFENAQPAAIVGEIDTQVIDAVRQYFNSRSSALAKEVETDLNDQERLIRKPTEEKENKVFCSPLGHEKW